MAKYEYRKEFFRRWNLELHKQDDSGVIEWLDLLKANKVSMNKVIATSVYEFFEKHEFDDVNDIREYVDAKR